LPRRKEALAGAGERGILGVSRRAGRGKKDPARGSRKACLFSKKRSMQIEIIVNGSFLRGGHVLWETN
jgi:hypothetical protein